MKIVVVKSPRLLSGIFRIIFKIKREQPEGIAEKKVLMQSLSAYS